MNPEQETQPTEPPEGHREPSFILTDAAEQIDITEEERLKLSELKAIIDSRR